jgi:vacuolar-type H+-ATPase subunit F/Vma7
MRLAVLGERVRVEGYALAGAMVCPADDPAEVRAAWRDLPPDVAVVILTPAAARALGGAPGAEPGPSGPSAPPGRLTAVLPP